MTPNRYLLRSTYSTLILLEIDFVAEHDLSRKRQRRGPSTTSTSDGVPYEGEVLWVSRRRLNQEFIPPAIQGLEALGVVDIVY